MVDTGEGKESWFRALSAILSSENATISHAIITHHHFDHIGGVRSLLKLCPGARIYKHQPTSPQLDINDGQLFQTEGATLRALYCPGHTEDHMAFILEQECAMFTGDNVLGHGTAVFEDLELYMDSLRRMKDQVAGRAYPGHGAVIPDSRAKIEEYIKHRQQREDEVLRALESVAKGELGVDKKVLIAREVVEIVYRDIPKGLYDAAERGVTLILQKLYREGKVIVDADDRNKWRIVGWRGTNFGV